MSILWVVLTKSIILGIIATFISHLAGSLILDMAMRSDKKINALVIWKLEGVGLRILCRLHQLFLILQKSYI